MAATRKCPLCETPGKEMGNEDKGHVVEMSNVKIFINGMEKTFEEATTKYVETYYPSLESTYRVPAALFYDDEEYHVTNYELRQRKKGLRKGGAEHNKVTGVETNRMGKKAVGEIVNRLHKWGFRQKQPFFIFYDYKFHDFLKYVHNSPRTEEEGDHDILAIHRDYGILAIQVKNSSKEKELKKAWKQVQKDERVFKTLNKDLSYVKKIPFHKRLAINGLTADSSPMKQMCDTHRNIIATKEHFMDQKKFEDFLLLENGAETFGPRRPPDQDEHVMNDEQFKALVGRYVGLASSVLFRTLPEAITEAGKRIVTLQLNPQQDKILRTPITRCVLHGEFGTGKTLLLVKKAMQIVATRTDSEKDVRIISLSGILDDHKFEHRATPLLPEHIKSFLTDQDKDIRVEELMETDVAKKVLGKLRAASIITTNIEEFIPLLLTELLSEARGKDLYLFFDEVPSRWSDCFIKLNENFSKISLIWLVQTSDDLSWSNSPSETNGYNVALLDKSMRMTESIHHFLSAIAKTFGDSMSNFVPGNVVVGSKSMVHTLKSCTCQSTSCVCLPARIESTLREVFQHVAPNQGQKYKICILVPPPQSITRSGADQTLILDRNFSIFEIMSVSDAVLKACKNLNLSIRDNVTKCLGPTNSNLTFDPYKCHYVTITFYNEFRGCESDVIIMFGEPNTLWPSARYFVGAMSRSLAQFVLVKFAPGEYKDDGAKEFLKGEFPVSEGAKTENALYNMYKELEGDSAVVFPTGK